MGAVPFGIATGLGMAPAIFLTAAAGDAGVVSSPRAVASLLVAIGLLAGLLALIRPALRRWLALSRPASNPDQKTDVPG